MEDQEAGDSSQSSLLLYPLFDDGAQQDHGSQGPRWPLPDVPRYGVVLPNPLCSSWLQGVRRGCSALVARVVAPQCPRPPHEVNLAGNNLGLLDQATSQGGTSMQMLKSFVTGLVVLLVLGLTTLAQDREQRRPEGPTLLPPGILERLDLTADQKEKIAKIEKEFQEKIAPAKKKLEEAIEQARQNQDRQKAQEAQEAFRKEVTPIGDAFGEKVGQLLTDEQRRRVEEFSPQQRGGPPFDVARILGRLDLTTEQKEKAEKWMKEVGEKHESGRSRGAGETEPGSGEGPGTVPGPREGDGQAARGIAAAGAGRAD
jgi:hypothetical protein